MVELIKRNCELCKKEKTCYRLLDEKSIKFFCKECLGDAENRNLKEKFKEQINFKWKEV